MQARAGLQAGWEMRQAFQVPSGVPSTIQNVPMAEEKICGSIHQRAHALESMALSTGMKAISK